MRMYPSRPKELVPQMMVITPETLMQQLAHLCDLMREFRSEQASKRHEKTNSYRATSSTSGCGNLFVTPPNQEVTRIVSTHAEVSSCVIGQNSLARNLNHNTTNCFGFFFSPACSFFDLLIYFFS